MTRREELQASIEEELNAALKPFTGKSFSSGLREAIVAVLTKRVPTFPDERYRVRSEMVAPGVFSCTVEDLWLGEQWRDKT